jgi:hypothetical protein
LLTTYHNRAATVKYQKGVEKFSDLAANSFTKLNEKEKCPEELLSSGHSDRMATAWLVSTASAR